MPISTWRDRAQPRQGSGGLPFVSMRDDGNYVFRFFEIKHTVTEVDYFLGRYPKAAIGEEAVELFATQRIHFKPIMDCPEFIGNAGHEAHCERCDEARRLQSDPAADKATKEDARRNLMATDKRVFVVICISEPKKQKRPTDGFLVFDTSSRKIVEELGTIHDEFVAKRRSAWGWNGRDIIITKNSSRQPQDVYKVRVADSEDSTSLTADLVGKAQVPDLLSMPNFSPPSMRHFFTVAAKEEAAAAVAPAPAPAAKTPPKRAAKAKAPWPPLAKQEIQVVFEDGSAAPGIVRGVLDDGKFKVQYEVDGEAYDADVDLADIKPKE